MIKPQFERADSEVRIPDEQPTSLHLFVRTLSSAVRGRISRLYAVAPSIALLLCLPGITNAVAQSGDSTPPAVVSGLVQRFIQAQKSYDPPTLKELTADNYVEVSPLGEVDTREAMLGFYNPAQRVDVPSASVSDQNVRVFGDTAVDIVAIKYEVAESGKPSHDVMIRATFVAIRQQGVWKLASAQYNTIQPHAAKH
jgi:uncharacterized protein (TIGR02246 family)